MFDVIDERNEQIIAANDSRRALVRRLANTHGRAARRKVREELAAMEPFRRPVGPSSKQSIRRTLRSALNDAIRRGKITANAAKDVVLPSGRPPKPMMWTAGRVELWRQTGTRPGPVMVWTPDQTGAFLDSIYQHRLYALYHLVAYRGPRRGEVCGLNWPDVDLDQKKMLIQWQLVVVGWEVQRTRPKTEAGVREVVLDDLTVEEFYRHRERQRDERHVMGLGWDPSGPVFTTLEGEPLHPAAVSTEFQDLIVKAGVPPIRLHDARHVAATLMHGGGADLKVIQETLGHSSYEVTANIYTSVLEERAREAAEGAAQLVPRTPARMVAHTPRTPSQSQEDHKMAKPQVRTSALGGNRTPNLLIRSQMLCPLSYEREPATVVAGVASLQHGGADLADGRAPGHM